MTHILLVDDHAVGREGVKRILAGEPAIVIAGEAEHHQVGKQIAYELGLSVETISTHRRRLLNKLRLHTTADLVRYTIRHGLAE